MTEISNPPKARIVPLSESLRKRFYEPAVLLHCLQTIYRSANLIEPPEADFAPDGSQEEQLFYCFVNKLGQMCDSRRGRDTATSFAVLHPGTVQYRFASNSRSANELEDVKVYITDVLRTVGCAAESVVNDTNPHNALFSEILQKILNYNRLRILSYIRNMALEMDICMEMISNQETDDARAALRDLSILHPLVEFARRTPKVNGTEYTTACQTLLYAIDGSYRSESHSLTEFLQLKVRLDPLNLNTPWKGLLHAFGRLHSNFKNVQVLISARRLWPSLFVDFEVVPIPSSEPSPGPPAIRMSTPGILRRMARNPDALNIYHRNASFLQTLGLDDLVKRASKFNRFRLIVHAEVLVDDSIRRLDRLRPLQGHEPSPFFNEASFGRYIGSGRPICHLCALYFAARSRDQDAVKVRASHSNLYCNWRPPDVLEGEDTDIDKQRRVKLEYMINVLRNETWRALEVRQVAVNRFDSTDSLVVQLSDSAEMDVGMAVTPDRGDTDIAPMTSREPVTKDEEDGSTTTSNYRANPSPNRSQDRAGADTLAYIDAQAARR